MTIIDLTDRRSPVRVATRHHAAVIRGQAGAIVSLSRPPGEPAIVTAVERFPYRVEPVAARIRALRAEDRRCSISIDGEGLGDALWQYLSRPGRFVPYIRGLHLYTKRRTERAELTRELVVAVARRTFTIAPGLKEADALKRALVDLTRDVKEDGPGSELTIALALALLDRPARLAILGLSG